MELARRSVRPPRRWRVHAGCGARAVCAPVVFLPSNVRRVLESQTDVHANWNEVTVVVVTTPSAPTGNREVGMGVSARVGGGVGDMAFFCNVSPFLT